MALTQVSVEKKNITSRKKKRNRLEDTGIEDENEEVNKIENDKVKKRSSRINKRIKSG